LILREKIDNWDIMTKDKNIVNMEEKEWLFKIEMYKSLREESLGKMERQYRVIGFGVGGIGVLLGIAFQFQVYPLFLTLPILIIASMILFAAERDSIINVAEYLGHLERELISKQNVNGWDTWLRKKMQQEKKEYGSKAYMYFDSSAISILLVLLGGSILGILFFSGNVGSNVNNTLSSVNSIHGNISDYQALTDWNVRYVFSLIYGAVGVFVWIRFCLYFWYKFIYKTKSGPENDYLLLYNKFRK